MNHKIIIPTLAPSTTEDCCVRCKYFSHYGGSDEEWAKKIGFCRRFPPTLLLVDEDNEDGARLNAAFPMVSIEAVCGEFKLK